MRSFINAILMYKVLIFSDSLSYIIFRLRLNDLLLGGAFSLFKRIVVFFVLSLIAAPQFAFAAPSGNKPITSDITSSQAPRIQPPTPTTPTPIPTPTPDPIPTTPIKPQPIKFALTFDDGPSPQYTPQVLALLDKFEAHGTFFMVGTNVSQYPKLLQQVAAKGNEIAAHTMTHPDPDYLSDSELDYEITASVTVLRETSDQPVHYFRPPYGAHNYIYRKKAPELDVKIVCWTVDPRDWSGINSDLIAERVLDNLEPGCIVLLHDGGGNRQETVDALEIILREANARGYNSVTLSNLEM